MNDIAPHPVYPGFHSLPLVEVSMNKTKWDALPQDLQETLIASVKVFQENQVNTLMERDLEAVDAARAAGTVTIHE